MNLLIPCAERSRAALAVTAVLDAIADQPSHGDRCACDPVTGAVDAGCFAAAVAGLYSAGQADVIVALPDGRPRAAALDAIARVAGGTPQPASGLALATWHVWQPQQ